MTDSVINLNRIIILNKMTNLTFTDEVSPLFLTEI